MRLFTFIAAILVACAWIAPATAQSIKVKGGSAIEGTTNVAVGSFIVAFIKDKKDKVTTRGGKAVMSEVELGNVSQQDMQDVTDAAYADLLEQLQAAGFAVTDHAAFETAAAEVKPMDSGIERLVFFGDDAKGHAKWYAPSGFKGVYLSRDYDVSQIGGSPFAMLKYMPGILGTEGLIKDFPKASGATLVNLLLVIDFADVDKYKSVFGNRVSLTTSTSLAVAPGSTQMLVSTPGGKMAKMTLGSPIAHPGEFGELLNSNSSSQKVYNVLGALGGFSKKSTVFAADTPVWRQGSGAVIHDANAAFVAQIVAAR